ncbi:response regulator MprA [Arthrobacter sp. Hiyo4]|nr:response regulator MprA [Arthrobacter sp. Hiyo4]
MLAVESASAGYDVDVAVVEDDPLLAELLGHALTTRGYRHRHFADGRAAADQLAGSPAALRARVLLLDVDLPILNGLGVLREMASTGSLADTRVIMLTARSSEQEIVDALEQGAFDHVAKPFSVPVLMQRLRRALGS